MVTVAKPRVLANPGCYYGNMQQLNLSFSCPANMQKNWMRYSRAKKFAFRRELQDIKYEQVEKERSVQCVLALLCPSPMRGH